MAERQIVVLIVAGSSPVPHPCLAFVAQLDRAPDFESVGRSRAVSSAGRATDS